MIGWVDGIIEMDTATTDTDSVTDMDMDVDMIRLM
jgi:hypothetical protein